MTSYQENKTKQPIDFLSVDNRSRKNK